MKKNGDGVTPVFTLKKSVNPELVFTQHRELSYSSLNISMYFLGTPCVRIIFHYVGQCML